MPDICLIFHYGKATQRLQGCVPWLPSHSFVYLLYQRAVIAAVVLVINILHLSYVFYIKARIKP